MEFEIVGIHDRVTEYDLTRAIMGVLHSEDFYNPEDPKARPMNFDVKLVESKIRGYSHDGRATLTLPDRKIGKRFLGWTRTEDNIVRLMGRRLKFYPLPGKPTKGLTETLKKVPFIDPDKRREREHKLDALTDAVRVLRVQFGVFYITPGQVGRSFSIEWDHDCTTQDVAWLMFHYDHKVIRIKLGDPVSADTLYTIVIKFTSINKIGAGSDSGNPFICLDLRTPVILEKEDYHRTMTGDDHKDNRKFRQRLIALDSAHARCAPYAHHLRLVLVNHKDIPLFARLCEVSGIPIPIKAAIDASQRQMFSAKQLMNIRRWVAARNWSTAWQIELLLHNYLVNTEELLNDLYVPINRLYDEDPEKCAQVLRNFVEALQSPARPRGESALACFQRVSADKLAKAPMEVPLGMFPCHHVTFTPTRQILEGPYAVQSNRVIRRYPGYQDHFIRVDFRDEDRLQYRWDREVDGSSFLQDRVGRVLKNGFEIAGRYFEFLAYSSSALREHSVWFVNPFDNPGNKYHQNVTTINAAEIRKTLGDFTGVIYQPAKYAARMAQAFTATDPSVTITRDQWKEIPDLGDPPYEHTDGVGTISPELGNMIWEALCNDKSELRQRKVQPTAYQIRFLGYKGMVGVDWELEGIQMNLRKSMNKFRAHETDRAEIEIARAFDKPMVCMMNKSLVMILEDRGVSKDVFLAMQNNAKRDVILAEREIELFRKLLRDQNLGGPFYLSYTTDKLRKLGFEMEQSPQGDTRIDLPFYNRLVKFATHHALRDMKHGARIPIPKGWLLPGIADEGPAYEEAGYSNVYKLKENFIFACVQGPEDEEPHWLKGSCTIWRSPAVHPGDVQRVFAMGRPPPDDVICPFRHSKNVVVLPSVGKRSLASMLGGGDVDGDLFYISQEPGLLPTEHVGPAAYEPAAPVLLDRRAQIEDVCDFVVNYISSDVLGLLSNRHLLIADQSMEGTRDEACIELARLCGLAVDFPKSGVPVDIKRSPRLLIKFKPDWSAAEVVNPDRAEYYESTRALGYLYRDVDLPELPEPPTQGVAQRMPIRDQVSFAVLDQILRFLPDEMPTDEEPQWLTDLFQGYLNELRFIMSTHTLSNIAGTKLTEEEVVIGTILAECPQKRWRKDRIQRLKLHSSVLARGIERTILPNLRAATRDELLVGLERAWNAWCFSVRYQLYPAAPSFGLIALGLIFAIIDHLESVIA